jgi:D-alanine--poly(phosphoribitol) ligase subunit 2
MKEKLLEILCGICDSDIVKKNQEINLFENNLLDSMGVIELLVAIESTFGIVVDPIDLQRSDIETPLRVVNYFSKL